MSDTLQSALERGQEARIVQIDFSAAFGMVNHLIILYKLCSVGIGGSVLSTLTQFLSNRSQHTMVDGCQSKLVMVVSGVPLEGAVSVAQFLTGGVFECDIAHRRSMTVLCMLYKIRCNPMHPLKGTLPGPYVPVQVTRSALVAHWYSYAQPHCRTLQYSRTFIPLSVSLWNDLANPVFDSVGLAGFKSRANAFSFIGLSCSIPTIIYSFSLSLLSVYSLVLWGWGLRTDRVYITLSQPCTADLFLIIIIIIIIMVYY